MQEDNITDVPAGTPAPEKMMFVYIDELFNIKAISPIEDESYTYKYLMFPLNDVRAFLNGEASISNFRVEQDKKNFTKFEIVPKMVELDNIRYKESFLNEIYGTNMNAEIRVVHQTLSKNIQVKLNSTLRDKILEEAQVAAGNISVVSVPVLKFYFCLNKNPNFLVHTLEVSTDKLINDGHVWIPVSDETDLSDTTIYHKPVFKSYSHEIYQK